MDAQQGFLTTLEQLRHGDIVGELSAELTDLVAAVRATGGKGSLTLVITVKPASKGEVFTLLLEDDIKLKLPKLPKGSTVLFATDGNALQRQDPRQPELSGLRTPGTVTQIREVAKS